MVLEGFAGIVLHSRVYLGPIPGFTIGWFFFFFFCMHANGGTFICNDLHWSSSLPGAWTMALNLSLSVQVFWM